MRWTQPQRGETKTKTRFLWRPLTLPVKSGGVTRIKDGEPLLETRWLEVATIEYRFDVTSSDRGWNPVCFVDGG